MNMLADRLIGRRQPSLPRAAFLAALAPLHRNTLAAGGLGLVALVLGALLGMFADSTKAQQALPALIGFAVVIWWWLAASRILPLCMSLAAERVPRLASAVASALAGQLVLSVLLPALLLAVLGSHPLQAVAVCGLAAMIGLLLASIPSSWVLILLIVIPALAGLLPAELRTLSIAAVVDRDPLPVALLLAGINALLWTRWLRTDVAADPAAGPIAVLLHQPGRNQAAANSDPLGRWLNASRSSYRTESPHSRLRVALGRPFHHLGGSGVAIEVAMHAGVIASWVVIGAGGRLASPMIAFFASAMLVFIATAPSIRLFALRNRPSAELAELPLLPGLPPPNAPGVLAQVVLHTQVRSVLIALPLYCGFLIWTNAPTALLLMLPVIAACALALGHVTALWAASLGSAAIPIAAAVMVWPLLLASTVLLSKLPPGSGAAHWIWLPWLAISAVALMLISPARRRLRRLPHPFLTQ